MDAQRLFKSSLTRPTAAGSASLFTGRAFGLGRPSQRAGPTGPNPLMVRQFKVNFAYGMLNVNTVRSFLVSSTAAKRADNTGKGATAIPNAAPTAESIENSATKVPFS